MPHLKCGRALLPWAVVATGKVLSLPRARREQPAARPPAADVPCGTVILPFGRYFAGRADLLTRDGFKTVVPIDGVSPFSGMGEPDPVMQRFADSERTNERVQTDVCKDLPARMAEAEVQFLVVDNSTALLPHREVGGRLYTVLPGEDTDLMDMLWNADPAQAGSLAFKLSADGFTDRLRSTYDSFVRACLDNFDPARIILVRSHCARFWVADDGTIAPTDIDRRDARFLEALDDYFIARTSCRVADGTLGCFPSAVSWQSFDDRLRRAIEEDLVELCTSHRANDAPGPADADRARHLSREMSAADHVIGAFRAGHLVRERWLRKYFAAGGATYDDLLALAYLEQRDPGGGGELIRSCVRYAVADPSSHPLAVTRRRFDRSLDALRRWRWGPLAGLRGLWWGSLQRSLRGWGWGRLRRVRGRLRTLQGRRWRRLWALHGWWLGALRVRDGALWAPQIAVPCGSVVFRFLGDGSLRRVPVSRLSVSDAGAVVEGQLPVTPLNLLDVLGSWPVYLERGRRAITAAPQVVVSDVAELVNTCSWIDWAKVLDNERVVITTANPASVPARWPEAKTDLSFVFDPNNRICTVGGGLMDQVTHIALFDDLCRPHGLDYYLDDLRYTWHRSHNGFEASRLAPELERRRITRLVSPALIESFRAEVTRTRLPWVFNQSRVWYDFGLREATVVTRDYFNSRRLMEMGPEFPVLIYHNDDELGGLIRQPPTPICFYTTQHRMPIAPESADAIRRVFSYHHLEANGLDPEVAQTAKLLRSAPYVAFHVRRGDYLHPHFDTGGWHARQDHYIKAIEYLIESEFGTSDFNVAVFSDDLDFVEAHRSNYGLDRVTGQVWSIRGNSHFMSIFDSYLMSLCPIIVGSVGFFAATTSLLADPPSVFIRARPDEVKVEWRR
jgi:hypothetical protein